MEKFTEQQLLQSIMNFQINNRGLYPDLICLNCYDADELQEELRYLDPFYRGSLGISFYRGARLVRSIDIKRGEVILSVIEYKIYR